MSEPRPSSSILTPTLGILSAVVVLLCIAGVIMVVFLRRQCRREGPPVANSDNSANLTHSDSAVIQNGSAAGAATISKTSRGGVNPRSQSLKPLMGSVDCDLDAGGPMFVARIDPDHWKDQMFAHSPATQLGWPVGEPPPAQALPPPPPSLLLAQPPPIEAGLITPPYTTDSTLELRSPDIIPPPTIGTHFA